MEVSQMVYERHLFTGEEDEKNSEVEDPRVCQGSFRMVSNSEWTLTSHREIGPEDL